MPASTKILRRKIEDLLRKDEEVLLAVAKFLKMQ
jgi:hypothetical protein